MKRENEIAVQRANTRMIQRICGVTLRDKLLRQRLGIEVTSTVEQQNRSRWYEQEGQ